MIAAIARLTPAGARSSSTGLSCCSAAASNATSTGSKAMASAVRSGAPEVAVGGGAPRDGLTGGGRRRAPGHIVPPRRCGRREISTAHAMVAPDHLTTPCREVVGPRRCYSLQECGRKLDGAASVEKACALRRQLDVRPPLGGVLDDGFDEIRRQFRIRLEHQCNRAGDDGCCHARPGHAEVRECRGIDRSSQPCSGVQVVDRAASGCE